MHAELTMGGMPEIGDPVTVIWQDPVLGVQVFEGVVTRQDELDGPVLLVAINVPYTMLHPGTNKVSSGVRSERVARSLDREGRTWLRGHGEKVRAALMTAFVLME